LTYKFPVFGIASNSSLDVVFNSEKAYT